MDSTDSSAGCQQQLHLPPGFRFHPTDEELVVQYLKKKTASAPLPVAIIAEVDLYKFDPWELPAKASFGEQEWYFFTPRDRKYPNGARPNRAATSGYWKATGTDKPVLSISVSGGTQKVGVKKALVFYGGKPPKGIKTNWIMHEYRLIDNNKSPNMKPPGCDIASKKGSLRLDDWVLCRIYKKNNSQRPQMDNESCDSMSEMIYATIPAAALCIQTGQQHQKLPAGLKAPTTSTSYGVMLENEQSMLHYMMNNSDGSLSLSGTAKSQLSLPSPNVMSMKRALFWDEDSGPWPLSNKRFVGPDHQDNADGSIVQDDNGTVASFLAQFNQTPQAQTLQQQGAMFANLGDGAYRQPSTYQLPAGLNWFS